jgi:hypothetical protein
MTNPYASLPDHCFWSRGVTWVHPAQVDPMANTPFMIAPTDKVATMGSCFAQHISRRLQAAGFNYFVPETAPEGMSEAEAKAANYGVFSARYGNVYTVKQAVQLFERAFGEATYEEVWELGDRFVDPFRPQIQPKGFETREALEASRDAHLAAVRRVFEEADVLVFTLGLTEAWRSIKTGAVYPTAPGVAGGRYDPAEHEAVNYRVEEVIADLDLFITKARAVNPGVRIILTVSPVPLKATFEDRHVLQSTVYSKSVLRVAAQHAHDAYGDLVYFPSYEIITGPGSAGRYYAPDLREVRDVGVAHVMRIFEQHFIRGEDVSAPAPIVIETMAPKGDIVCDEDVIEAALEMSRVDMRVGDKGAEAGFNLSERDVREGYRLFLGRDPESQAVIDAHRGHPTLASFRSTLLNCEEFRNRAGDGEAERLMKILSWATGQAHSAA